MIKLILPPPGYYTKDELKIFGFINFGKNVLISQKASLYLTDKMSFGDNVRIDDFCLLVGNIYIGSNIHIGAYSGLHASKGSITLADNSTLSSGVTVYAGSDDYSGETAFGLFASEKDKNEVVTDVFIDEYALIGTGATLLPKSYIPQGTAVGAMSLVIKPLEPWGIYAGIPCRRLKDRAKTFLKAK